ncbi:MAG: hypothetical protein R2711_13655 [Acidimicrobiales bacterium]
MEGDLRETSDAGLVVAISRYHRTRSPRRTGATPGRVRPRAAPARQRRPRRGDRAGRCSCASGTIPTSSIRAGSSLRSFLLAQCHGRSVNLLRSGDLAAPS